MNDMKDRYVNLSKDRSTAIRGSDSRILVIGGILIAVILLVGLLAVMRTRTDPKPAPPAPAPRVAVQPAPAAAPAPEADAQEVSMQDSEIAEGEEPEPYRDGINKICEGLADDFVNSASQTAEQQRRTLMIYNINRCNNSYIRDADARNHKLTPKELEAVVADTDPGPLRTEDK